MINVSEIMKIIDERETQKTAASTSKFVYKERFQIIWNWIFI